MAALNEASLANPARSRNGRASSKAMGCAQDALILIERADDLQADR